jgi:peptide-methionine (S)-S-oxide reductase
MERYKVVSQSNALPGRLSPMKISGRHVVHGRTMAPPFPDGHEQVVFGMGCFWGAERKFWSLPGVYTTAVGYSAGYTPNPTYEEVCTGMTAHNEVVMVIFDPTLISFSSLLKVFFESHNPTQSMRQGNDIGTQYRSGIYTSSGQQLEDAINARNCYQKILLEQGFSEITTEIMPANDFYYAEEYHQQYLAKNPNGYCGLGGTGIKCNW